MILIYGDSLAQGLTLSKPHHTEAFPGYTIEQLLNNIFGLSFLLDEDQYECVVIIAGTNDLGCSLNHNEIIDNLIELHRIAWNRDIPTIMVLTYNREFNKKLKEKLGYEIRYCDYLEYTKDRCNDDIHLNEVGRQMLQRELDNLV